MKEQIGSSCLANISSSNLSSPVLTEDISENHINYNVMNNLWRNKTQPDSLGLNHQQNKRIKDFCGKTGTSEFSSIGKMQRYRRDKYLTNVLPFKKSTAPVCAVCARIGPKKVANKGKSSRNQLFAALQTDAFCCKRLFHK